jgi:TolA-binding protein
MPSTRILAIATLMVSGFFLTGRAFAASKEQMEMQRDIAQLQDQVRTLQSGFDQKMASLLTISQQALDAANKANTNVSVLSSTVSQTLERELNSKMTPVAGLAAKVDNINNDVSEVRNQVSDLNTQVNKILQILTDVNAQIKVLQAPPAAPPTAPGAGPNGAGGPPVPAATLFTNAERDQNGGKLDLALSEFADFMKFYPDDPNTVNAQYNIGEIHYAQNKLDLAVTDFDSIIERYPDSKLAPDAYFMKGMALKQSAHRDAAATTFRALIGKFPRSGKSEEAKEQLRAMGVSASTPAATSKRRQPH